MQGVLVLADGTVYKGEAFGAKGRSTGEVVFNTSMTGYQEILSDPSYCGQIITMTYPLIGHYGVNDEDMESGKSHARGMIVREYSPVVSNWRATGTLEDFLKEKGIIGLAGIDTRSLTRRLRNKGTMAGIIATEEDPAHLFAELKETPVLEGTDYVKEVTASSRYELPGNGPCVAVVDLGVKQSILNAFQKAGFRLVVFPAAATADEILSIQPRGVLFTNGPGDPKAVPYAIKTARELMGKVPLFGICLGHQIFALALGADTYKLPFGHRSGNHAVKDLQTGKIYITSQNHGFAVQPSSLAASGAEVTHLSINDNTVEGFIHKDLRLFSVQYHPEAYPGPVDSIHLFDTFFNMID